MLSLITVAQARLFFKDDASLTHRLSPTSISQNAIGGVRRHRKQTDRAANRMGSEKSVKLFPRERIVNAHAGKAMATVAKSAVAVPTVAIVTSNNNIMVGVMS